MTGQWVEARWGDLQVGARIRLDDGQLGTLDGRRWAPHALSQASGPRELLVDIVLDEGGLTERRVLETNTVWVEVEL